MEGLPLHHFQGYKPLFKRRGPQGHLDRVPLPRGVKFKTSCVMVENASLSTSAHLTLIIAPRLPGPLCGFNFLT